MVQWLGLCVLTAEGPTWGIPTWGIKIPLAARCGKKKKKKNHTKNHESRRKNHGRFLKILEWEVFSK